MESIIDLQHHISGDSPILTAQTKSHAILWFGLWASCSHGVFDYMYHLKAYPNIFV